MVLVLLNGLSENKHTISPPTHIPRTSFFVTVKDIFGVFYRTKHQVRGLCVGRDMVILFSQARQFLQRPLYRRHIYFMHMPLRNID